jgi:hypothetical protein
MATPIDFHDEAQGGRIKVSDETLCDDHLPAEDNAQLAPAEGLPQGGLRRIQRGAHLGSASSEQLRASEAMMTSAQEDSFGPAKRPGSSLMARPL